MGNRSAGGALASRPHASAHAYRVEVVTDIDELSALEQPWQRLLLASPTATAFASPAWLLTWFRQFQPRSGIYAVTVWRDGELVGVAPFACNRFGGRHAGFTLLVSAGTEHGDYGDPLLGPEPLSVARVIADHLVHLVHHEDTAVNLRRLRDDDPLLAMLESRDDVTCKPMGHQADNAIVRFADLDDPEATLARIARKRDLPRLRRRLTETHGDVTFTGATPDTAAALDHMRDFLARRWSPGEGPKLFASPGREAFTHDVTAALVAAGLARVSTLSAGGRTVAVTIDQRLGDRQVGDATSFDPDLRNFAVGLMHLHEVLAGALADGVAQVDLRAGDFPYKDQWATARQGTRSVALVCPGPLGQAQLAARRLAMSVRARRLTHHERARPTAAPGRAQEEITVTDHPVNGDVPQVSVVIPARNAADLLDQQLAALARQEAPVPWEVVVADNGSTDTTRALAESWRDRLPIRVIDAAGTPGINHARNRGTAEARGDLLVYCDADDVVQPGLLAAYWQSRDDWDMAGGFVEATSLNDPRLLARHPHWKFGGLASFGWLKTFMGCNFAVHRAVHTAIGGFDETFLGGCDDIDFAFRGQLAGHRLGYVPQAVVSYRLRDSLRAAVRQHYRYGRTRAHLYRKFKPSGMPRRSWKHTVRSYGLTVAHLPKVLTHEGRARWMIDSAFLAGMATGSLHDRTLYLSE